jgi:hypothetical protein
MNGAPVGRGQIFEAIMSQLASPKPGIIVVRGEAGSGRTHLLQHVAPAAEELGYRVLIGTDADPVTIVPSTTMADVRRRLRAMKEMGTAVATTVNGRDGKAEPREAKGALRRGLDWATSKLDVDREISALLRQLAPLLVAIDGFRPGGAFRFWFTNIFIPRVRAADQQVALVIAGGPEDLGSLADVTDLPVSLGPLDDAEVRAHLSRAAEGFAPPLTPEELEKYVTVATDQPAVFSALSTVFRAYHPAPAEVHS